MWKPKDWVFFWVVSAMLVLAVLNAVGVIPSWAYWVAFAGYCATVAYRYFWPRPVCANAWRTADDRRPVQWCDCGRKSCGGNA